MPPSQTAERRTLGSSGAHLFAGLAVLLAVTAGLEAQARPEAGEAESTPVRSFRNFDKRSAPGLPQSTATALYQDERGILWIATLDGLAFFDGTSIHPVAPGPDAPVRGALRSLAPRRAGGFYAGGPAAVYVFDGKDWSLIPAPGSSHSLAEDEHGVLWRVDQAGNVLTQTLPDAGEESAGTAEDWQAEDWHGPALPEDVGSGVAAGAKDTSLWVVGSRGVLHRKSGEWHRVAAGVSPPEPIKAFLPSSDGAVWIGTQDGGVYFADPDDGGWSAVELPGWRGGWIRVLAEDRRGRIWAGGNDSQVAFGRRGGTWTVWDERNGLHPAGRMAILADREGSIWFSSNGRGLQQWLGEAWSHRNLWHQEGLTERLALVFGISGNADGSFLAAVFNRGVWRWDGREMHQLGQAEGLTEDVRLAMEPEPGVIWAATRYGIFESRDDGRFRQVLRIPDGFVYRFYRAPDGVWHATSTAGIYRLDDEGWRGVERWNRELSNTNVRDVLWHTNGELWAATMGGIVVFDPQGAARPVARDSPGPPIGVNALLEVDGEVWAGDFGGLRIVNDSGSRRLTAADGLPGDTIYSLTRAPDGAVWAGGSAGVGRFADGRWTVYDMSDGLIGAECNLNGLWASPDGSVYVGTMASLARFDTGVETLPSPPLAIYWGDRPEPGADGLAHLPADRRLVRLAWTAPWLEPRRVEYRLRIPRLRAEWSAPQAETYRTLENLGPGDWQVEVAARFAGQREWTEPIVARFRIAPYFWETWTFYGLLAAVALCGLFAATRWRTRHLAERARRLEKAVQEQVAQIKVLGGLLPICAGCKKVRDDAGYWQQIENYIREHTEAEFSHGLCPDCFRDLYPEMVEDEGVASGEPSVHDR